MSNTEIPLKEVDLSTRRQRLYHVTWLNRYRLDMQIRPLLRELEESPGDNGRMSVLFKATFRGAITLINHYLHFDVREHPSAILLVLLRILDDRTFDSVWADYAPMLKWVNKDINGHKTDEASTASFAVNGQTDIQYGTASRLPDAHDRYEGIREDDVQPDTPAKSGRKKTDSDSRQ